MALIEGVGDEVVQFVCAVVVVVVGALAWCSTNARPDRYRTVLVMRSRAHHPVTVSIRARMITGSQHTTSSQDSTASASESTSSITPNSTEETPREGARVIPLQEMDSIVDADMAMLDNNRLHFYRRMDAQSGPVSAGPSGAGAVAGAVAGAAAGAEAEAAGAAQMREMDSIVSAMEADVAADCEFFTRSSESDTSSSASETEIKNNESSNNRSELPATASEASRPAEDVKDGPSEVAPAAGDASRRILIKLKYLNDTLKEVEGSLDELLTDFKCRHFSAELSTRAVVRLVFRGRVLDEGCTLRACGLHHRAVVHALVHPPRARGERGPGGRAATPGGATHELVSEGAAAERAWDLENILMTLVSVALTVVWFVRCEYSNMFTASASVALFGLTVFYSVAIFGLYLSDTFHFERRAPPPGPPPHH